MRYKENLYGKLPEGEGQLTVKAMKQVALVEKEKLMNPSDLEVGFTFDPKNPLYCTCDLVVALLGLIYGETEKGGVVRRFWFYKNEELAKQGLMANKEHGAHYRYFNKSTGELDFTYCQFPVEYFLYRHKPDKRGFEFGGAKIGTRLKLLVPGVIEICRKEINSISSPTSDFVNYLK